MGRKIFTVRGRIAVSDGSPIAAAYVAIVDADPDLDDLLGAGATNADGAFRLSFTTEAFNQEALEDESTPDLYVVVSLPKKGAGNTVLEPALRRDFGKLAFANPSREEDLGTIVVPSSPLASLRVAPGRGKIVKRVQLDEEIVELAAREITPLVERMTGWSDLRDGVEIHIVDSYRADQRERIQRDLGRSDLTPHQLAQIEATAGVCAATLVASWHPEERLILLNRPLLEDQGFDFLKVTIGHELVHAGQSRVMPDAATTLRRARIERWERILAGQSVPADVLRASRVLMMNIEGYAHYIEARWLRAIYTHAAELPRPTAEADAYFLRYVGAAPPPAASPVAGAATTVAEHLDPVLAVPFGQYTIGENFYRLRTNGDRPAPFDVNLQCDEHHVPEVLAALALFQAEHGAATAKQ